MLSQLKLPPGTPAPFRSLSRITTLLTNFALLATGILTSVQVSRALGPEGRGQYVTWQAWAATIGVVALAGLPQILVLDDVTAGRHSRSQTLKSLYWTVTPAVVMVCSLLWVRRASGETIVAAILIAGATQFGAVAAAEAQRLGKMRIEFNAARLLPMIAALAAMTGLVMGGVKSPTTWLVTVGALQAAATIAWVVWTTPNDSRTVPRPPIASLRESIRVAPGTWVTQIQYRFDLLAVGIICSHETVGYYAVGVAAQGAVLAAGQASGMDWFSRKRSGGRNRMANLRQEFIVTCAVSTLTAIPLVALSGFWVTGVYGHAFKPAIPVVVVLSLVGVIQSIDYLASHECLISNNRGKIAIYRVPSIGLMIVGFIVAHLTEWSPLTITLIPLVGYTVSSATFFYAASRTASEARMSGVAVPVEDATRVDAN